MHPPSPHPPGGGGGGVIPMKLNSQVQRPGELAAAAEAEAEGEDGETLKAEEAFKVF